MLKIKTNTEFEVECSACGYYEQDTSANFSNKTQYSIWLEEAGWKTSKNGNLCPDCVAQNKKAEC